MNHYMILLDGLSYSSTLQHSSGAYILQDVGGIDFLSKLRSDICPEDQGYLDSLLEYLFHLPYHDQNRHKLCVYEQPENTISKYEQVSLFFFTEHFYIYTFHGKYF